MTMKMILSIPTITAMSLLSSHGLAQEAEDDFSLLDTPEEVSPVYTSEIEIGAGWSSKDSFKFGEYSGLTDRGPFIIGNFSILQRDAWDGDSANYWALHGTDLGLSSRALGLEFGKQGTYKINLDYDQIPKNLLDDARTPYISLDGGTNLTLPAGWVASNRNVSDLTLLNESLQDIKITHERSKYGGGFTVNLSKEWTISSKASRETKKGNRTIAGIFGSSGGNPAGAIIAEPIDYETDNYNLAVGYVSKKAQFTLSYNLSQFENNKQTLRFQNPFASTSWATPSTSYPTGFGQMQLAPDNKAQRVTFAGRYKVTDQTRLTANLEYGKLTQNDPFAAYTIDPNVVIGIPMPRASLNGEIINTLAKFGMTSSINKDLNVSLSYRYNNRDNNTPQDLFVTVHNESGTQGAESSGRYNRPYSRKQHQFNAGLGYRLSSDLKLDLGYEYEQLERDYQEVAKNKEHKFKAKLRANPSGRYSGWMAVDYSSRTGSEYIDNNPFLVSTFDPDPEEFENHPLLRKSYMANRDRLKFSASTSFEASDNVMLFLTGHYAKDDYKDTIFGLKESKNASITFDTTYQAGNDVDAHAYITYEDYSRDQAGYGRRGNDPVDLLDAKSWNIGTGDKVTSVGLGFEWNPDKKPYSVVFDYNYSHAITDYAMAAGPDISFVPLPNLKTNIHNIDLKADYEYTDNITIRLRYLFEDYSTNDFSLDGINPDSMRYVIGLGNQSPNYSVHVFGLSTVYKF